MGRGLGKKWVGFWHVCKASRSVIAHGQESSSQTTICAQADPSCPAQRNVSAPAFPEQLKASFMLH